VVLCVDGDSPVVAQAAGEGVDILEARVDRFSELDPESVADEVQALQRHQLPLIGTVRSAREGGAASMAERHRAQLYARIAPLVDAVDIDLSAAILQEVIRAARSSKKTLILSYHDFDRTPPEETLRGVVRKARALGADLIKIAAKARGERDVVRLLWFTLQHAARHLATIAMGSQGAISRLAFPLAGSLLTYTSVSPAEGQVPAKRLIEDLRLYYPAYNDALINRLGLLEYA
jgi:3-dehydroquinate dehydratase-1